MSGPLPSTNTRKLFTPTTLAVARLGPSANPSATGMPPPTLVVTPPVATPEQPSNAPEQSAKLIIIDGVAASPAALPNSPCVSCSKLTAPGWNDAATAAYSTLHGPVAIVV